MTPTDRAVPDGRLTDADALRGVYNVVQRDARRVFERVHVDDFRRQLRSRDLTGDVCVTGLAEVLEADDGRADALVSAMRARVDYLNGQRPLPAIQFVVDGELQTTGSSLELVVDNQLYPLDPFFHRAPIRRGDGWFVVPYRI